MDFFKWQPSIFHCLLILSLLHQTKTPDFRRENKKYAFSPCCYFPCKNGGFCNEGNNDYFCDCMHTGFYGKTCDFRIWSLFLWNQLDNLLKYFLFNPLSSFIINNLDFLHTIFQSIFIESLVEKLEGHYFSPTGSHYLNIANAYNACIGSQLLPPVPNFCPTPLGNQGLKKLPSVDTIFKNLLERNDFVKNKKSLNLLFVIFGQNLALQFKHCNYVNWITCSQIYSQNQRSYKHGKLSVHIKQGEEFPKISRDQLGWIARGERAKPNYLVSQNTLTFLISTIWLREHNRICDILLSLWPAWDDERLFQTARNIVTGELLAITYTEWVKSFSHVPIELRYKPLKYPSIVSNTVPVEIYMAFHWPYTFPDELLLDETPTNSSNLILALEPSQIYKHGVYKMIASLSKMQAGQSGPRSISKSLAGVTKMLINEGRYHKLQSFNQYRSYFKLSKYKKFNELVGNKNLNEELTKMYGNIDGLEFIIGLFLESGNNRRLLGETSDHLIKNWLLKAIMTHPLSTDKFCKSTSMGGKIGLKIIKGANLKDLICQNVVEKDLCFSENLVKFNYKKSMYKTERFKKEETKYKNDGKKKINEDKKIGKTTLFDWPFLNLNKLLKFIN